VSQRGHLGVERGARGLVGVLGARLLDSSRLLGPQLRAQRLAFLLFGVELALAPLLLLQEKRDLRQLDSKR
jgi:hypothetical protein